MYNNNYTDPSQENRLRNVEMGNWKFIYQQLLVKFPSVPPQDVACSLNNFLLQICEQEKELLKWILPTGKFKGGEYEDHQYTYGSPYTNTSRTGSIGRWQAKKYACAGEGILTLVKHIKGYKSDLDCVVGVAACLGIDFSKTDVQQLNTRRGFTFIENVEAYPTNFYEDFVSAFLGKPVRKFYYFTEQGALSSNLNQYADDARNPIFLHETRDLCENTNSAVDCLMAPPFQSMLYNLHQISLCPDEKIFIHDDICRAADSKFPGVNTYAGGLPYVDKMPWNFLKGRDVTYVYNPDMSSSVRIGGKLIGIFSDMGIKLKLIAITVAFPTLQGKAKYVPVTMRDLDFEEFYADALASHGIDLKPQEQDNPLCIRTLDDNNDVIGDENHFIIEPLVREGETCMVIGGYGSGKTGFSKLFSYACVNGYFWGNRFSIPRPTRVFYIDSENDPKQSNAMDRKIIKGNGLNVLKLKNNFSFIHCRELRENLDLSDPDTRNAIAARCKKDGIGLIIIDNYGGVVPLSFERSADGWRTIFSWCRSLNDANISVWIVQHTNKAGDQRGTLKISDDMDLIIKVEKASPERKEFFAAGSTVAEISIEKARYLHGEQCAPFLIGYKEEDGGIKAHILSLEGQPFESAVLLPDSEKAEHDFDALEEEIIRRARSVFPESVGNGDFKNGEPGRSSTTVNDKLNRLVERGLLERHGQNKGTKYTAVMKNNSSEKQV